MEDFFGHGKRSYGNEEPDQNIGTDGLEEPPDIREKAKTFIYDNVGLRKALAFGSGSHVFSLKEGVAPEGRTRPGKTEGKVPKASDKKKTGCQSQT